MLSNSVAQARLVFIARPPFSTTSPLLVFPPPFSGAHTSYPPVPPVIPIPSYTYALGKYQLCLRKERGDREEQSPTVR